jgi:membrane-bound lytic murein transglycosylase D
MKKQLTLSLLFIFSTIIFNAQNTKSLATSEITYALNSYDFENVNILNKGTNEVFSSEILKKRLKELNNQTPFNVEYNATVERFIRLYLKTRKSDISNLMDKAQYYFPIFEEHLDKFDLPLEIKYLAVVESALDPNARSVAGAKGLWQIMYNTGKEYDLNVSSYIDERSDPIKATQAACKYLQYLYNRFNDWDLALAAYNAGPGNVSKAIRRSGGLRNYWNIRKYLPKETSSYLPAFYATYYLFEYGEQHQIYPKNDFITYHDIDTVLITKKISFSEIKKRTSIDENLLKFLNPQYRLRVIPTQNSEKYILTLPKSYINKFVLSEKNKKWHEIEIPKIEKPSYITPNYQNSYVVENGDNLNKIAKKFNISITQLKTWNGLQTDYLIEGQSLVITKNTVNKDEQKSQNQAVTSIQKFNAYIVQEGDSLWLISKRFPNITINQIRNWNNIWGVNYLKPGTELKILTE